MAEASFKLKVFTPAGALLEEQVTSVTLTTAVGEIQVLPQHTKYIGALGIGVLECTPVSAKNTTRMVLCGGFGTFSADTLTILADTVDLPGKTDKQKLASQRDKFQATLAAGDALDPQWQLAKDGLARLEALDRL